MRKLRVFLCHASQDKPIVRRLHQRLAGEAWIDPWLDEKKLLPGQDWQLEIQKALRLSDALIFCASQKAISKEGFIHKELHLALDFALEKPEGKIFIIPLRLEKCNLPERLSRLHWVDLFKKDGYSRLIESLFLIARRKKIGVSVPPSKITQSPIIKEKESTTTATSGQRKGHQRKKSELTKQPASQKNQYQELLDSIVKIIARDLADE